MPAQTENFFNHVFSEIFEEPSIDLNRIRPSEQLWFITMGLNRVIGELESPELVVFSHMLGLDDKDAKSTGEVATLMGIEEGVVRAHYAEGLRKVRIHPEVERMRPIVRGAVIK